MRKDNYQDFQGNDQYEGFCVDMLRELADILKFSFKIKLVDDGLYGAPEPNGSWTGMVGELINRVSTVQDSQGRAQQLCSHTPSLLSHACSVAPNHNSAVTSHVLNCPQRRIRLLCRTKTDLIILQKRAVELPEIAFPHCTLKLLSLLPPCPSLGAFLTETG